MAAVISSVPGFQQRESVFVGLPQLRPHAGEHEFAGQTRRRQLLTLVIVMVSMSPVWRGAHSYVSSKVSATRA
jgi:hypothetical protein